MTLLSSDNKLAMIAAILADKPVSSVGEPLLQTRWYAPTDADATTLAARFGWTAHDLWGNRQANGSTASPFVMASDGSDADALLYAAFGLDVVGLRQLWGADNREAAVALIDSLVPLTPEARDNRLQGSGQMTLDCAALLILTNKIVGGGLAGSPRLGFAGATTVAEAVKAVFAQSSRKPGDAGASGI